MMLIATPDTTWSPRWLTQANPCTHDMLTATAMAAISASVVEPKAAPLAPAAKAASNILPSSAISTTPERSDNRHGAGKQHDQPLQRDHHVAAEAGDLERQLGAALVQRAEQQRRQHDAHRVVAPDQATAMPVKPAPTTNSSSSGCAARRRSR
jgi:hypothetical protein